MDIVTQIIVWCSPVLFGVVVWVFKDLLDDLRSDVKDTKSTVHRVEKKQIEHDTKIIGIEARLNEVGKHVDSTRHMTHEIDKRTANVQELNGTISLLSKRLDASDKNYGKILQIIDKVAIHVGLKKPGT